jgi:anti-sigma-K factor RskA
MTNHERLEELIPIYALGALDGEELREVEDHIKSGCGACAELLREQEQVSSLIAYSVTTPDPSHRVKERLLKKIKPIQEAREKATVPNFWEGLQSMWLKLGGAVALALLLLLLLNNVSLRNSLKNQGLEMTRLQNQTAEQMKNIESLSTKLENKDAEIARLKEQIGSESEVAQYLENPDVVVINLVGPQPDLKARGRVLWDTRQNKAFFYGLNLPETPPGKTYQLWVIADSTPISAGIFKVNNEEGSIMKLESLPDPAKIQKFAVTLEPDGGVPQPTGEMYLLGES